jgi:transcription elongation factor Elf1
VPELSLEEFVFFAPDEAVSASERRTRQRAPIPGPTEFAISLKAFVGTVALNCPLCGHREVQGHREERENTQIIKSLSCGVTYSDRQRIVFHSITRYSSQLLFRTELYSDHRSFSIDDRMQII